jgi:hypothetical protein
MSAQRVHVWFDRTGRIAAVGQPLGEHRVVPVSNAGLQVIEVVVDAAEVADLHATHRVAPGTGTLIAAD